MLLKKTLTNTILYALGPQLPRVFNFLLLPIFTRYLSAEDYGISGLIYSYVGLLGGLGDLGLHVRYANVFFKFPNQWREKWRNILGILFWWSLVYSLLQSLILYLLLPEETGVNKLTIIGLMFTSSILFSAYSGVALRLLQYREKALIVSILNATLGILTIGLNYYFIVVKRNGYMGWFYTQFIINCLQGIFCLYYLFFVERIRINTILQRRYTTSLLIVTTPLVLHNYASYLLDSSDRFLLDKFNVSIEKIGLYNFAYIFGLYFDFAISSLGYAVSPMLAKIYYSKVPERKEALQRFLSIVQVALIIIAFVGCLFIKEFLAFFVSNPDLKECYYLSVILIFSYSYKPMYWYYNAILTYNNKTKVLWQITFLAGGINFVLNIIFIPFWGIYASAVSTLCAYLFMVIRGFNNKNFKMVNPAKLNYPVYLGAIVLLLAASLAIQDWSVMSKLLILAGFAAAGSGLLLRMYKTNILAYNFNQYDAVSRK